MTIQSPFEIPICNFGGFCWFVFIYLFVYCLNFKAGFLCVAMAFLECSLKTKLTSHSEIQPPLPLHARTRDVRHHCPTV